MKVTIITVCYNSINTILDTINSVAGQSYPNIEYLVVDGCSTDGTLELLNKNSKFITKIVSEKDHGIYSAMNKGINLSSGDIIGFLNSDDFYVNNKVIEKIVKKFSDNFSLDVCYSDLVYVDRYKTSKIVRYWKSSNFFPGYFSKGWCPPHPTFFVKKYAYQSKGIYNLNYGLAADVELMMRFLEVCKLKSGYIPEILVKMRLGGATNNNLKNIFNHNLNITSALNDHGLKLNKYYFYFYKILMRLKQFIQRP
jgi:glycosyltransferase involved in cell wall biosynthesis